MINLLRCFLTEMIGVQVLSITVVGMWRWIVTAIVAQDSEENRRPYRMPLAQNGETFFLENL
jgi:hypothetical protein